MKTQQSTQEPTEQEGGISLIDEAINKISLLIAKLNEEGIKLDDDFKQDIYVYALENIHKYKTVDAMITHIFNMIMEQYQNDVSDEVTIIAYHMLPSNQPALNYAFRDVSNKLLLEELYNIMTRDLSELEFNVLDLLYGITRAKQEKEVISTVLGIPVSLITPIENHALETLYIWNSDVLKDFF